MHATWPVLIHAADCTMQACMQALLWFPPGALQTESQPAFRQSVDTTGVADTGLENLMAQMSGLFEIASINPLLLQAQERPAPWDDLPHMAGLT